MLIEIGQPDLIERGFRNPTQPRLDVEVFAFADLIQRLPGPQFARPHRLDFHQLTLVTAGEGRAMIDFVEYACRPGTLLHTRPGQVQRLPTAADDRRPADLVATVVLFTAAFPATLPLAAEVINDPFGVAAHHLQPAELDTFTRAIVELGVEYDAQRTEPDEVAVALLRQLLGTLLLRLSRLAGPRDVAVPRVKETFRRFTHELERSFAVVHGAQAYADRLGYSARTLNRACRQASGRTAKQLIDDRVALEAKRLLVHTDLPIAVIGGRLGFTEPTNFAKFFTRNTSHTPTAFRAEMR
jgi:AraC-like DNA-binding protein